MAGSTTSRGLGWDHQKNRARLMRSHTDGTPCWWCGRGMYRDKTKNWDSQPLEADHTQARSQGGTKADRLLCSTCNRQRGDGSRDHLRPALTGHKAPATQAMPQNGFQTVPVTFT